MNDTINYHVRFLSDLIQGLVKATLTRNGVASEGAKIYFCSVEPSICKAIVNIVETFVRQYNGL